MNLFYAHKPVGSLAVLMLLFACNNPKDIPEELPQNSGEVSYNHTLKVGKDKPYKTISAAAAAAKDSTLIEVDAGLYSGDVAVWRQNEICVRAVGGEVILDANGQSYDGKGIWEVAVGKGKFRVEGITFKNAKVPDNNGAGIRLTSGELIVENCRFLYNEMGILTANQGGILIIRNSEFGYGGYGDGYSHNLYVGYIDKVVISGSYFHHANNGHLLKSRAKVSIVQYCRITDENDVNSLASYELDFPSGGICVVVGNIIQQSDNSPNTSIVAFAEEVNNKWTTNLLYLSHNTILNGKSSTNPLFSNSNSTPNGSIYMLNNLLSENTTMPSDQRINTDKGNKTYQKPEINADYKPSKVLYDKLVDKIEPNIDKYLTAEVKSQDISLIPVSEYVHKCSVKNLTSAPTIAGAVQND